MASPMVVLCAFPERPMMLNIFSCAYWHSYIFFEMSVQISCPFKKSSSYRNSFYVLDPSTLLDMCTADIFSIHGLPFHFLNGIC